MRTQRECTKSVRRRALLPGGFLLTGLLVGMLAIAAFAASGPDVISVQKDNPKSKQAQIVKVDEVVGQPDVEGSSAIASPFNTPVTGHASPTTLDRAASAPGVTPFVAPANDECTGAVTIPDGPYPVVSAVTNIQEATPPSGVDSGEASCAVSDFTVWYQFTPSLTAAYTLSTCQGTGATGSDVYDTLLAVYESDGTCAAITEVGCNDSPGAACTTAGGTAPYWDQGIVSAVLNAGTTYFIMVGHWADDPAQTGGPGVSPGANRVAVEIERSSAPTNDTCSDPTPLFLNRAVRGTTVLAENDYASPNTAACYAGVGQSPSSGPGGDVVYSFTAPAAGNYSIRYIQDTAAPPLRSQDPVLYASSSCPASGTVSCLSGANRMFPASGQNKGEEIYCLPMTAGQEIFVFFDDNAAGNVGGEHDIEVFNCVTEVEPNDTTATATPLPACLTEGTTSPGGAGGDIEFFSLGTPPAGSKVFAGLDNGQTNNADWEMRITNSTDTLQYDDNDGASLIGSNSPLISGAPTDGTETFIRLNHKVAAGAEPYHLYARVETGPAQVETEPNDPGPGFVSRVAAQPLTGGGFVRGASAASNDADCFRFVGFEGDDLVMFGGSNPNRTAGPIVDVWPTLYDLAGSGYNLTFFGGQVARNILTASPGTLTGVTPSITSEFWTHRLRYTGTQVICFYPVQANGTYPLPWQGSLSLNCNAIPAPSASNADVSITKTGPAGPVPSGTEFAYTIEVTNNSATDIAQDVRFTDDLPAGLTLVDALVNDGFGAQNISCASLDEDLIDCTNFSIAPGETTTWTFVVQVDECFAPDTEMTNTAEIVSTSSTDPNSANDSSTWTFFTIDGPCSDGNACTDDSCQSGACVGVNDDTNACDDGNGCTDDSCSAGACQGTPNTAPCDDGNGCTDDICGGGSCQGTPNTAPCDDGNGCTDDICGGGSCQGTPNTAPCDDGNVCTDDICGGGACVGTPDDTNPCDDSQFCTVNDACSGGTCVGAPNECLDDDPCTIDQCDEVQGCFNSFNQGNLCDDGNSCTGIDVCLNDPVPGCYGFDAQPEGTPCDDGNACTTGDACDAPAPPEGGGSGACLPGAPNTDPCDDGEFCTTGDTCGGGSCQPGGPTDCDDTDACTADSCSSGACVNEPIPGCGQVCPANPSPKNLAYWKRLCRGPHGGDAITLDDASCVASQGDFFADVDEVKDICDALGVGISLSGVCSKGAAGLMALALNICHERLCDATPIDSNYSDNTNVGESYDESDDLLGSPSGANCFLAKHLTDEIIKGQAVNFGAGATTEETRIDRQESTTKRLASDTR